jgi:hypothetical protein
MLQEGIMVVTCKSFPIYKVKDVYLTLGRHSIHGLRTSHRRCMS